MADSTKGLTYAQTGSFSKSETAELNTNYGAALTHEFDDVTQAILVDAAAAGVLKCQLVGDAGSTTVSCPAGLTFLPFKITQITAGTTVGKVIAFLA